MRFSSKKLITIMIFFIIVSIWIVGSASAQVNTESKVAKVERVEKKQTPQVSQPPPAVMPDLPTLVDIPTDFTPAIHETVLVPPSIEITEPVTVVTTVPGLPQVEPELQPMVEMPVMPPISPPPPNVRVPQITVATQVPARIEPEAPPLLPSAPSVSKSGERMSHKVESASEKAP